MSRLAKTLLVGALAVPALARGGGGGRHVGGLHGRHGDQHGDRHHGFTNPWRRGFAESSETLETVESSHPTESSETNGPPSSGPFTKPAADLVEASKEAAEVKPKLAPKPQNVAVAAEPAIAQEEQPSRMMPPLSPMRRQCPPCPDCDALVDQTDRRLAAEAQRLLTDLRSLIGEGQGGLAPQRLVDMERKLYEQLQRLWKHDNPTEPTAAPAVCGVSQCLAPSGKCFAVDRDDCVGPCVFMHTDGSCIKKVIKPATTEPPTKPVTPVAEGKCVPHGDWEGDKYSKICSRFDRAMCGLSSAVSMIEYTPRCHWLDHDSSSTTTEEPATTTTQEPTETPLVPIRVPPVYQPQWGTHCGNGPSCGGGNANDFFLPDTNLRYVAAPNRYDVSHCEAICDAHDGCAGFIYAQWPTKNDPRCFFRKSTTCEVRKNSNRDCYSKPTTTTTEAAAAMHVIVSGNYPCVKTGAPCNPQKRCAADDLTQFPTKDTGMEKATLGVTCCDAKGRGTRPGCFKDATFAQAIDHCASNGLELCSAEQIVKGAGEATGCKFDHGMVWTIDACDGSDNTEAPISTEEPTTTTTTGEPKTTTTTEAPTEPAAPECAGSWTQWLNRDLPTASGDWETTADFAKEQPERMCQGTASGIQARVRATKQAAQEGVTDRQFKFYSAEKGFVCVNKEGALDGSRCKDYEVRFCCDQPITSTTTTTTTEEPTTTTTTTTTEAPVTTSTSTTTAAPAGARWVKDASHKGQVADCPGVDVKGPAADTNGNYKYSTLSNCKALCEKTETCNFLSRYVDVGRGDQDAWHCYFHACPDPAQVTWLKQNRWGNGKQNAVAYYLPDRLNDWPTTTTTEEPTTSTTTTTTEEPTTTTTEEPTTTTTSTTSSTTTTEEPTTTTTTTTTVGPDEPASSVSVSVADAQDTTLSPDFSQLTVQVTEGETRLTLSSFNAWGEQATYCYLYGEGEDRFFVSLPATATAAAKLTQDKGADGHFETILNAALPVEAEAKASKTVALPHSEAFDGCRVRDVWCYSMASKDKVGPISLQATGCVGRTEQPKPNQPTTITASISAVWNGVTESLTEKVKPVVEEVAQTFQVEVASKVEKVQEVVSVRSATSSLRSRLGL